MANEYKIVETHFSGGGPGISGSMIAEENAIKRKKFEENLQWLSSIGWTLVGPVQVGDRVLVATLSRPVRNAAPEAWGNYD